MPDVDAKFGQHVAEEMRATEDPTAKQWAKKMIQNMLCDVQAGTFPRPGVCTMSAMQQPTYYGREYMSQYFHAPIKMPLSQSPKSNGAMQNNTWESGNMDGNKSYLQL